MHDATHEYDENCEGCQPALFDIEAGKPMSNDHPYMVAIRQAFSQEPLTDRRAWHRVVMQNSQNSHDLAIANAVATRMQNAMLDARASE
jgi:hypothetical protein